MNWWQGVALGCLAGAAYLAFHWLADRKKPK